MVDLGLEGGLADCAEVVFIPLMLTERGERAKVQNEIVDEEHDATPPIRSLVGDALRTRNPEWPLASSGRGGTQDSNRFARLGESFLPLCRQCTKS
jgi:hypothetical protein